MHRSGTSAFTRVLNLLGAALPKHLMPAGNFNERGHWESTEIAKVNDTILASMDLAWYDWRDIAKDWFRSESAKSFQSRLAEVIREEYGDARLFVIKDPRICRLLPLWLDVLQEMRVTPYVVMPVRNPIEVAQSLLRRDQSMGDLRQPKMVHAQLLWLRSVLEAERASRSLPRAFITYDALLDDWQTAVAEIASRTRLRWPRNPAIAAPEIDQFLSERLRHYAVKRDDLDVNSEITSWVKGAFSVLLEMARHGSDTRQFSKLDNLRSALEDSSRLFSPLILEGERQTEANRQTIIRLTSDLSNAKDDIESAQENLEASVSLKTDLDQALKREQYLHDELEKRRNELQSSTQLLDNYLEALQSAKIATETLEGQLKTSRNNEAREAANAQRLSVDIADLKEAHIVAVRDAVASAQKLKENEAKLDLESRRLQQLDEQLSRLRERAEVDHKVNERLRRQLAAILPERTALAQQREKLELELDQAAVRAKDQVIALRDGADALKERNTQLSLLALKGTVARDMAAAAKIVRQKMGQMPLGSIIENAQLRPSLRMRTDARRKRRTEWKIVASSGLFEAQWYLAHNPDVAAVGIDPFRHFMSHGIEEDRDPHPLFSSGWYRIQMHRHGVPMDVPPLLHYLAVGRAQHLSPHPLFDPQYYRASYRDVAESGVDSLEHFLTYGAAERRNPHPLIWMERLAEQPGFVATSRNALVDYLSNPELFAASPHPLFNAAAYLADNPDVARAAVNPLLHYCAAGWRQGRAAHRVFAGDWYLVRNPDVFAADIDPLAHYLRYGAQEYRDPHPLFDIKFYYARYRDARRLPYDALSDYVMNGLGDNPRETTTQISVAEIRALLPAYLLDGKAPVAAFLDSDFAVAKLAASGDRPRTHQAAAWPPAPVPAYWLPQRLRDYIIDRFGDGVIGLYIYLMAMVERYGRRQNSFPQTRDFTMLCDRLNLLAGKRQGDGDVDVSIVVPVFNNIIYTLTSLVSLLGQDSRRSYEILIGDDGSTDATPKVFGAAGGCVRLIQHKENLGFLGNCNCTASFAGGRYLVFLNNDTLLLPGWLDALIDALEDTPQAGVAGSKLLNADGSLQEAGGILWRDGSGWNYGRNDDPGLPGYNYLKDVDYVSGASLGLPTALWRQLGGFDAEFAPAYCEDSDLAFRVRQTGLRTLYAPHSMLIHHEGKSHGRDTGSGIKVYQVENQKKLFARWQSVLEHNHPNAQNVFVARDRSTRKPHILVVDHYVPQWDRDAGSRTMFHFLRMFVAAGFQVTFWPDNLFEDKAYCAPLQRMGVEVIYGHSYVGGFEKFMCEAGPFLDYALVCRPNVAIKYYEAIRSHGKARILYYGHDIHWKRMEREFAIAAAADPDALEKIDTMRSLERENWYKADVVFYPSVEERDLVRSLVWEGTAEQVPMLGYLPRELDLARQNLARFEHRSADDLLFVGGSHPPNVDALVWFSGEVMPHILAGNPRARLNIVGATMTAVVERLDSDAIRVLGRVSDDELSALYAAMGVAVVPLRYGAGVKGKTIEAFVNAIPLVTTPVGLQGIASDKPLAFVADDAQHFANSVLRAQLDKATARTQVEAAVRYMEQCYSVQAMRDAFAPFVHELISARDDAAAAAAGPQGA